jgi:hypothetical protein
MDDANFSLGLCASKFFGSSLWLAAGARNRSDRRICYKEIIARNLHQRIVRNNVARVKSKNAFDGNGSAIP